MNQQIITPQKTKIGKTPVVVLPIEEWEQIEDSLEDLQIYRSDQLRKDIRKARQEAKRGEVFNIGEVERMVLK